MNAFTSIAPVGPVDMPPMSKGADDPGREIRIGGAVVGLFLIGFVGWASIARLDAAVHGQGVVRVSGDRQVIQSPVGGVVSAIKVAEGGNVAAGQVLVEFATTEALAQERSIASRVVGLQAEIARISAERLGQARVQAPPEFTALTGADRAEADRALEMEQSELDARNGLISSQRAVLQQRIAQVSNQIDGYGQRQSSNARQSALNQEELVAYDQLYKKGFATKARVLALQRSAAAIDGERGATTAEMARLRNAAGETRMQMMQIASERQQQNAERLRTAQTELQTMLPQWQAARDQLDRTAVRAPVAGTVVGLMVHTIGAVAQSGAKLMEIVPVRGPLVVETQVSSSEANDLRQGQKAEVRLVSLLGRNLPVLNGTVSRVSADSFTEERSGRTYYTASVQIPRAEIDRASRSAGLDGPIRSGTPVEVTVPVVPRTALEYLIGPLTNRVSHSFTER